MSGKLLAGLSVGLILTCSSVVVLADDEAPVVDASSSYQVQAQKPGENDAPVAEASKGDDSDKQAEADQVKQPTLEDSLNPPAPSEARVALPSNLNNLPTEKRVQRLEQQVNNIANMNLPQQITLLQQQIAQLRGQLEVQGHDLQLVNAQLRSFYKDLDSRINQMNNLNSGNNSTQAASANNKASSAPTNVELQDANAYQVAFSQLVNHQLDKSQQSFNSYLNQYPNGKYVADSHYWLGEIYLSNKDYKNATQEFETVLNKYPQSSKVSDAKLKIAIIHANTGNVDRAKSELQSIQHSHPDSTAAQLANIRLQQLDEGPDLTGN